MPTPPTRPPRDEEELLARARVLAGLTLGALAEAAGEATPADFRRHKGWVGQLLERWLGASAASLAEPDFQTLGIELKTVPVDRLGRPRESTYVCTVPLESGHGERWEESWVCRKLGRVLWVPVEAEPTIPIPERRVGSALLWSPDPEAFRLLRQDWEELMEMVATGGIEQVTARHGQVLQIRPKAADSRARRGAHGADGAPIRTNPRGFYLRPGFTATILRRHYAVAAC